MNLDIAAKRVLIYGDSITWGRIPGSLKRFNPQERFTGIVQSELGGKYDIIEEGLRGRMGFGENLSFEEKDGYVQFAPIMLSHLPLDLVIIFLGTNDTQDKTSEEIVGNLKKYLALIKKCSDTFSMDIPKVCFVAPPLINEESLEPGSSYVGARKKISELTGLIRLMAEENACYFFDASKFQSGKDGIHLNVEENGFLGKELASFIRQI